MFRPFFFSLLRLGLWGGTIDEANFPLLSEKEWEELFATAKKQTVTGLVYDGVAALPAALQPEKALKMKLLTQVVRIEQRNRVMNHELAEMVRRFDSEGIRVVLLKGQGNALMYCNPLRRQSGDIDLYVGRENYERSCALVRQWNIIEDDAGYESVMHLNFRWHKQTVELHRLTTIFDISSYHRRFIEWSEQMLQTTTSLALIDGEEVAVPTPVFNAVFLFYHLYRHFYTVGVGMRQLCDWARCLYTLSDRIDRQELERQLTNFGLLRQWKIFGCILVDWLGLPQDCFPFYDSRMLAKAKRVMRNIEAEGNFGYYSEEQPSSPRPMFKEKLHSLYKKSKRTMSLLRLFPLDAAAYYMNFVFHGCALLVEEIGLRLRLIKNIRYR